ncbi:AurF N-oxygenase family protein [Gordonia polyisoprenivorans]|uniref:AurF N-oxygenase family protein n=1 Tax=Gordonia polyisoprenivorans TaxID=84595 RepID=UPI002301A737|nr:diiron oxygenase [Gordonia polyisoprenivorans]WCB40149.1 diiron oxygenase [Gordonia polyisoprenivorans]
MTTNSTSIPTTRPLDRNASADRLLDASMRRSYDSAVDVAWDAPQDPDVFYLPEEGISLYGTPLWESMSHRERVELSRQEVANMLSRGVWFENTLNQGLLRAMLYQDPSARDVHYALTEIGDETRHMIMFGRGATAVGAQPYRLSKLEAFTVQLFPTAYKGLMLWVAALCGEEVLDDLQGKTAHDPDIQPIVAQIFRIHTAEEARHIRYAREGVLRRLERASWWERAFVRQANGAAAFVLRRIMFNKEVYRRAGLNPREAMRQARANEQVNAVRREAFQPLYHFMVDNGLMGSLSRLMWRKHGFLA